MQIVLSFWEELSTRHWFANFCNSKVVVYLYTHQTASSSEAERNWSLFGFVQSKRRCSLKPTTMEKLVFIHANTRLIEKITDVCYEEPYTPWELPDDTDGETDDSESDSGSSSSD